MIVPRREVDGHIAQFSTSSSSSLPIPCLLVTVAPSVLTEELGERVADSLDLLQVTATTHCPHVKNLTICRTHLRGNTLTQLRRVLIHSKARLRKNDTLF